MTNILVASLRSVGIVSIGYVISFSTLCINICLNYLLIYGNCGFPELGVQGAAVATLVSRCIEADRHSVSEVPRKATVPDLEKAGLHGYQLSAGLYPRLPSRSAESGSWGAAQMVQTGILGHLGGDVTAANAIAV